MEEERAKTPRVIELVSRHRFDEARELIKANPESVYHVDDRNRSVLHEICRQVGNYLTIVPDDYSCESDLASDDNDENIHEKICELVQFVIDTSYLVEPVGASGHTEGRPSERELQTRRNHDQSVLLLADVNGNTPLHELCAHESDPSAMKVILDAAANTEGLSVHQLITSQNHHGCTPLHFIAQGSCPYSAAGFIMSYCEPNMDPTIVQDEDGDTCLHWACSDEDVSVRRLQVLLRHSSASLVVQNARGLFPLDYYLNQCADMDLDCEQIQAKVFSLIDTMIRAFHDSCDREVWFPIHALIRTPFCRPTALPMALATQEEELMKFDNVGMLPLHTAVSCRQQQDFQFVAAYENDFPPKMRLTTRIPYMIRYLLDAYPWAATIPTQSGRLPLFLAVESGQNVGIIKTLLAFTPHALASRDVKTRLFPFMLAAVEDNNSVDVVYELLCANPELVRSGVTEKCRE